MEMEGTYAELQEDHCKSDVADITSLVSFVLIRYLDPRRVPFGNIFGHAFATTDGWRMAFSWHAGCRSRRDHVFAEARDWRYRLLLDQVWRSMTFRAQFLWRQALAR